MEAFSITKLAKSPFTGMYWLKCIMFGLGIACIGFVGYGIYKAYFKTPEPTTTQEAEQIVNPSLQPKISPFGCASIRVQEYYNGQANN